MDEKQANLANICLLFIKPSKSNQRFFCSNEIDMCWLFSSLLIKRGFDNNIVNNRTWNPPFQWARVVNVSYVTTATHYLFLLVSVDPVFFENLVIASRLVCCVCSADC